MNYNKCNIKINFSQKSLLAVNYETEWIKF